MAIRCQSLRKPLFRYRAGAFCVLPGRFGRSRHSNPFLKSPDFEIAEPELAAVILQADIAGFDHVFVGALEFVGSTVRVLARRGPAVEIHIDDLLTVEGNADDIVFCIQNHVIPLAGRFAGIARGRLKIVDCATAMRGSRLATRGVEDLNLNAGLHGAIQIGPAEKHAAVGFGIVFELER